MFQITFKKKPARGKVELLCNKSSEFISLDENKGVSVKVN